MQIDKTKGQLLVAEFTMFFAWFVAFILCLAAGSPELWHAIMGLLAVTIASCIGCLLKLGAQEFIESIKGLTFDLNVRGGFGGNSESPEEGDSDIPEETD